MSVATRKDQLGMEKIINRAFTILFFTITAVHKTWAAVSPDAQIYFDSSIAALIEAPKCFECHTSGGSAGFTRLVFLAAGTNKNTYNAEQFDGLIGSFNSQYVLNKIKGINHGGGQQYSEISPGYQLFVTFFELLGRDFGDDDGDGVGNTADLCPNTSEGTQVDNTGCEINVELGTTWFTLPGTSCRATNPAVATKLQSRESGLTNTDVDALKIICPISIEKSLESSDIIDGWKINLNAANEGEDEFTLSCTAYEKEGLTAKPPIEKIMVLNDGASSNLAWDAEPLTNATSHAISCDLPSQGVIRSITIHRQ